MRFEFSAAPTVITSNDVVWFLVFIGAMWWSWLMMQRSDIQSKLIVNLHERIKELEDGQPIEGQ